MATWVEVDVDLENYLDECIEMLERKGYKVFQDNEEIQEYCYNWDVRYNQTYDSILGYLEEMKNKVYYENPSDDYKKLMKI